MTLGRFGGTVVLDRWGRVPGLRVCAPLAVAGLALVAVAPVPWMAVAALVIRGLGASPGFPVGILHSLLAVRVLLVLSFFLAPYTRKPA